jgi:uncharacterized protein YecA (UPF0149 family)
VSAAGLGRCELLTPRETQCVRAAVQLVHVDFGEGPVARLWCGLPHVPPALGHKVGQNEPCPCGSGWKFKRCCRVQRPQGGVT